MISDDSSSDSDSAARFKASQSSRSDKKSKSAAVDRGNDRSKHDRRSNRNYREKRSFSRERSRDRDRGGRPNADRSMRDDRNNRIADRRKDDMSGSRHERRNIEERRDRDDGRLTDKNVSGGRNDDSRNNRSDEHRRERKPSREDDRVKRRDNVEVDSSRDSKRSDGPKERNDNKRDSVRTLEKEDTRNSQRRETKNDRDTERCDARSEKIAPRQESKGVERHRDFRNDRVPERCDSRSRDRYDARNERDGNRFERRSNDVHETKNERDGNRFERRSNDIHDSRMNRDRHDARNLRDTDRQDHRINDREESRNIRTSDLRRNRTPEVESNVRRGESREERFINERMIQSSRSDRTREEKIYNESHIDSRRDDRRAENRTLGNTRELDHRKHDRRRSGDEGERSGNVLSNKNERHKEQSTERNLQRSRRDDRGSHISPIRFDEKNDSSRNSVVTPVKRTMELNEKVVIEKKTRRSKSPMTEDISDAEEKPISYYNMTREDLDNRQDEEVQETIHLSDTSEDEDALQRKLLLLEKELKKTKKKSKHKDKKSKKKKSRSGTDEASSESSRKHYKTDFCDVSLTVTTSVTDSSGPQQQRVVLQNNKKSSNKSVKHKEDESNEEGEIVSDSDDHLKSVDPSDLRQKLRGPQLPPQHIPDLRKKLSRSGDGGSPSTVSGPALPPHMKNVEAADIEGPALPPHLKNDKGRIFGPSLPAELRERLATTQSESGEDDEDVVGPLPVKSDKQMSETQRRLEERALKIKMAALEGPKEPKGDVREEWMLELPEAKAKLLGLGPRQFRSKEAPDMSDRSSWTDTPKEKALKAAGVVVESEEKMKEKLSTDAEMQYTRQRDEEQEEAAKKHKKKHKRDKSLLDLHQKKLDKQKKKEKESGEAEERRPFSREVDLKVNRFDEAQKKAIMRRAGQLDDKFSTGQAKYL